MKQTLVRKNIMSIPKERENVKGPICVLEWISYKYYHCQGGRNVLPF